MEAVKYTIVDMATGQIASSGEVPAPAVQRQKHAKQPGHVVMEGRYSDATHRFDLERGEFVQHTPPVPPEKVNHECAKRIRRRYSEHDQINALLAGDDRVEDIRDWVNAHRSAAQVLKTKSPIPVDFKADRHWPALPEGAPE